MAETPAANTTEAQELPVTFHPALFLQRRKWVFEVMRRENVTSVVDIGCGEGETIECLCNAAPWRAPPEDADPQAKADAKQDMLYVRKIHALDVSRGELELAKAATAPRTAGAWQSNTRWEPLEVHLWEGGLEVYNAEFVDAECMISTEVVEHLPEGILPEFAPMLLGVYHPRLLLITTPSYDFNARFTAPDAPPGTRKGYPDPTGRTDRIFRHSDHKFEWTVEEFRRWCAEVAEEWGYDVDISGIGRALEKDEWGRDEELGFASQVAAFSRRPGEDFERMREAKSVVTLMNAQSRQAHRIFATHRHTEHERSGKPASVHDIQSLVKGKMQSSQEAKLPVHYLWYDIDISESCGGWLHLLLQAVEQDPELTLHRQANERNTEWVIEFPGLIKEEEQTPPQTEAQTPHSWGAQTNVWSSWTSVDTVDKCGSDWVPDHAESWGMSSGEVWNEGWGTVPLEPGRA